MNQLQSTNTYLQKDFEFHIESILEEMLMENRMWKIHKVVVNYQRTEIHAYMYAIKSEFIPCSYCNQLNSPIIIQSDKIYSYLSILGLRTYIHAVAVMHRSNTYFP